MNRERFHSADYRFIAVCAALLAAATWFSVRNFHRAFPEASIDFRVSREEAQRTAARFLTGQGYLIDGYRQASRFNFDDDAKTFLEREAGLEQANRIMGTRVRLWRWSYRWFRPQQKEEYTVDITPAGEFAGFEHLAPEDASRPAATGDQARALAEAFLRTRLSRDPATLEFVESSEVARPRRVDRVFTWKERDFNLRGATNRVEVTLDGDEVAGYREYLKIPDQWTRDYARLRSKNDLASVVDTACLAALLLGLVAAIVIRVRGRDVRWRLAAAIGLAGAALAFLAALNELPLQEFGYPTTDSYGSFASRQLLDALGAALASGGLLWLLAAGAEPVYRAAFPARMSLGNLFRLRGLRTKSFFLGAILGVTLAGVFIAYQVVFYVTASRFGAWSPADVPYSDLLNTRFPWLFVLFGGFFPAVSEEFLFRMFAIPFLRKAARSLPAAVVLAAFLWGFGHSAYAQQPFYIRGVEVGIGGVALGLIMLRWGILPTLVWHYSVDALYSALLLLRSHSLYFRLSGAASAGIVALPVAAALAAYLMRGGFEPETGLLNGDQPAPAPEPAAAPSEPAEGAIGYEPLSRRRRLAVAALVIACLAVLLIPASRFGQSPTYKLTDGQARAAAGEFLRARGFDAGGFRAVAYPAAHWDGDDSLAAKYFLERRPVSAASALFERYRPARYWAVRYFKPLDQDEAMVAVHPETGKITGFQRTLPEDQRGADLSPEAARQIAAAFAAAQGWDTGALDLKESASEAKKARRDHTLTWEARPGDARNVDAARYRVEIVVSGDRVTTARAYWKLPEAWTRGRDRQNAISILALALRLASLSALAVFGLWMLIQAARRGLVRWRVAIALAVVPTLFALADPLLTLPLLLRNYPTAIPLETYQAMMYAGLAMSVVFVFLALGGASALITSFFPGTLASFRFSNRRALAADAAIALAAALALSLALGRIRAALTVFFPAQALLSIDAPDLIASAAPAVSALADAARATFMGAAVVALVALLIRHARKRWMLVPLAFTALFAFVSSDARTPAELALELGIASLSLAAAWFFCRRIARGNYLAYALVLWTLSLKASIATLFGAGNLALRAQGWTVVAVLALTVGWAVYPAFARRPNAPA
ncbi:MAG: CPBP family intramembrane glutamic endopeptidase [Bryobacteraceae bacterium]|jgi:membrane protease YdiL (CAAX protease family)